VETARHLAARAGALAPRTKMLAVAGVVAAGVAVTAAFACTRDTRTALFATPLYADQLAEVETHLAAWRVAYAPLADNVRVDPHARADLLLRLSLAGVPHRHLLTSDEAFAHAGALTPQTILEAQTRDALAADLAQGLRGLAGVADARVIVAPSSSGVYADEPVRDASASVRITLAPGARLAPATVAGIRAFVAGGVPGLDPQRVTVLDDSGTLDGVLAENDDAAVQTSLQSALDAAFGVGTTIVRAHREPLGEARDEHDTKRVALPGDLSRTAGDERYSADKKTYAKSTSTEERASDVHDVHRVASADATARLSVAIFVDGARAIDLSAVRELAAAAAGTVPARGDTVVVEAVRFASPGVSTLPGIDAWAIAGLFAGTLPQAALAIAAIVACAFGARPAGAFVARVFDAASVREATRGAAGLPPGRVHGALAGEPPHVAAAVISALPAATATAVLELYPPEERAQIVRRLARAAVDLVPRAEELLDARA
jgi:flagellar biosynthesis/type III secretory pathway M-ring protein FliF/YscJ